MNTFSHLLTHRPQGLFLRKALFQIHLWVGIGVGLYVLIVSITGASLVFRSQMQHVSYPELFPAAAGQGKQASLATVVEKMKAAYPEHEVVGVSVPTEEQHTFVGYIYKDETYRAVFADAATGSVIGAIPDRSILWWIQNLHFYLLSGNIGLFVNGIGGLFLFLLSVTGLLIWWPGIAGWRRGLKIDLRTNWKRINWDLHNAGGFWVMAFVFMWAVTGAYFAFPQVFRNAVSRISPVTTAPNVASNASLKGQRPQRDLQSFIDDASKRLPGATVTRVSLPTTDTGTVQVVLTHGTPVAREDASYVYFYFDRFSGELLNQRDLAKYTLGDRIMPWFGRLHVGEFGGVTVKVLWLVLGLTPALLFVTGLLMWWNRVVQPRIREAVRNRGSHAKLDQDQFKANVRG